MTTQQVIALPDRLRHEQRQVLQRKIDEADEEHRRTMERFHDNLSFRTAGQIKADALIEAGRALGILGGDV